MLIATMSQELGAEYLQLDPVRVGLIPPGIGTPNRYVTVTAQDTPFLRVDVYPYSPDTFAFQAVVIWSDIVIIGLGSHVHAISIANRSAITVALGSYFGYLHPTPDYLLIASAERIFRMNPDRSILWRSDTLGIDGVVVHDAGPPVVRGDGEWDPPDGWRPFAISANDGKATA